MSIASPSSRGAYSAVEQRELVPFERAGRAAVIRLGPPVQPVARLARRAVVALEEDRGVLAQAGLLELVEDRAHAIVHRRDHRGGDAPILGEVREAVDVLARRVHRPVRRAVRHVEEERPTRSPRPADERDGALGHEVREVLAVPPDLAPILPEVVRRIVPRVHIEVEDVRVVVDAAREEAEPLVEAAIVRPRTLTHAQVPLSVERGAIAERPEHPRERRHIRGETDGGAVPAQYRTYARVPRIATGEKARTRGRAHGRVRIPGAQDRAGRGEAIKIRGEEVRRAEAAEIARRLIVAKDDDEARRARHLHTNSDAIANRITLFWIAYLLSVLGIRFGLSSSRVVDGTRAIHAVLAPIAVVGLGLLEWRRGRA